MVSFNKLTRTLAGIAAAALIVPLAACGGSGNGGTATAEGIPAKGTDDGTEITLWTRSPLERQAKNVVEAYNNAFRAKWNQEPSAFGGHAYDGLLMAVEAIKTAGGTDKAKVRDAIENTKGFVGTGGVFNMSAEDHNGLDLSAFKMLEVKDGKWTLVE